MKSKQPNSATKTALEGIAKAMAQLELDKMEGYKKSKLGLKDKDEDEDEDDLVKVLEARAEEK